MTPITCISCRHFQPDDHNGDMAMGHCMHDAQHGYFFAQEQHRCADHSTKVKPETTDE